MSEIDAPSLYRSIAGRRTAGAPVACALRFDSRGPALSEAERVTWTPRACAVLRELLEEGRATGRDRGRSLPHASLRAAVAATVPQATLLERDLGAPWSDNPRAMLDVPGGVADLPRLLERALRLWTALALRPWAEDAGASEALVDALDGMGGEAFAITRRKGDLAKMISADLSFAEKRDAILQRVAGALEGRELFAGLGPVWRMVRAHGGSNEIEFLTWPARERDALQSMVARLAVETLPFSVEPILTVRAARRRWLPEMPAGGALRGQRSIGITLMSRNGAPVAVEVGAPVRAGAVGEPMGPEFLAQLLRTEADLAAPLTEQVARGAAGAAFAGAPYSPKHGGSHPLGAGVSTRDQLDLFDEVSAALEDEGFSGLPVEETPTLSRAPKRAPEHHKALEAEALLSDVALTIGRNDLDDDESIAAAWRSLDVDGDAPTFGADAAARARAKLEEVCAANVQRVRRAFGERAPRLVLIARTEAERRLLGVVVTSLFGGSLELDERPLPADVHGPRSLLPAADRKPKERFEARVAAWRPLAETLKRIENGSHALVQAADWYDRTPDDRVNKLAGRYALAAEGDANVQYLRPRGTGQRGFANYLHRVQAAVYDLVFGHAGLVSGIAEVVAGAFPDETSRPTCVVGISVLTQARTRLGAPAGRICLATRIDCASNRTTAKVGWHDGEMRWSREWEPLFSSLKRIASPEITASLGQGAAAERTNFQLFVRGVLDGCAEDGERPLVLIDGTGATGLWPWLADARISSEPTLGAERLDASTRWPGARLVRVRRGHAARMAERKAAAYQEVDPADGEDRGAEVDRYCPTIVARTVRVAGTGPKAHYWTTGGYFQMSLPRGLSVYRKLVSFVPIAKLADKVVAPPGHKRLFSPIGIDISDVSYRLPTPLETTVALLCEGDDPDRVAHLVASLREGYGHTAASTSLPAPLSFESKALDYMTRFGLDEAEQDDEGEPDAGPAASARSSPAAPPSDRDDDDDQEAAEVAAPDASAAPEPSLSPTDPRSWRKLIDRRGTAFMDGTSLSSPGVPPVLPFGTEAAAPTATGAPGMVPPSPEPADERPEPASQEPTSRSACIRLPDLYLADWLRSAINVTNGQLRAMHEDRDLVRRISGFEGWPDAKPDLQTFLEILPLGMRHPMFLAAISQAARRRMAASKAERWTPFKPLWERAYQHARSLQAQGGTGKTSSRSQTTVARTLADAGLSELAMGNIVHMSYAFRNPASLHDLVETDARFLAIREFMADAKRELFHADYSWFGMLEAPATIDQPAASSEPGTVDDKTLMTPPDAGVGELERVDPEAAAAPSVDAPDHVAAPDPQLGWARAMELISVAALEASTPDAAVVDAIASALRAAEEACALYEASRPKLVDVSHLFEAAARLATSIHSILSDADQNAGTADPLSPPTTPMAPPDQAATLELAISEIQPTVEAARLSLDQAREIMRNGLVSRLEEALSLRTGAVSDARDADARLRAALDELAAPVSEGVSGSQDGAAGPTAEPPAYATGAPPTRDEATATPASEPTTGGHAAIAAPAYEAATKRDNARSPEPPEEASSGDSGWEGFDDEDDGDKEEDEVAAPGAAAADVATPRAPHPPSAGTGEADPLADRLETRLADLVERHSFGLAYHLQLATAAAALPLEFPISSAELRLAAMAGHVNHATMQGSELLHRLLAEARDELEALEDDDQNADTRRILALGYASPFALYHPDPTGRQLLDSLRHVADGLGQQAHALREALAGPSNAGLNVSPALMKLASEDAEDDRYVQELTRRLLSELDDFSKKTYKFQLGVKLRNVLSRSDGELGRLQDRIARGGAGAIEAAREFATEYSARSAVLHLLETAELRTSNYKITGIDGVARDRMVGAVQMIAEICAELVQAGEAAPALRGTRQGVMRARSAIESAIASTVVALRTLETDKPLTASAARFATKALEQLLGSVRGSARLPTATDHLYAVHEPLLWIPALEFGQGWLPAPYVPEQIVGALIDEAADDHRDGDAAVLAGEIDRRIAKGSHVAASMLMDAAGFYGMPAAEVHTLAERRQADAQTRRDALAVEVRDARLLVDRLQRMGGTGSQDEAQSLLSLLDRISPEELPVIVPAESRSETPEARQILDFSAAYDVIRDVRAKVTALLQRPRDALMARIGALAGAAADADLAKVRSLVSHDDLLTATEYVEFLEDGRALPESTSPNPRLDAFFPGVPDTIMAMSKDERDRIGASIAAGTDVGPLRFSRVPGERRAEHRAAHEAWRELKRAVAALSTEAEVAGKLARLLGLFGIDAEIRSSNARGNRRLYATDMRFDLPLDKGSVLLPDFGSLTGGDYRVCVASKLPTETELSALRREAGVLRIIVFLTEAISAERRRQLLLGCLEGGTKLLVVDEAIVTFAISEPELRGQTLVECAQPFSFAEPYRDYGNAAVPREMFFGRAVEQRKLLEPHGSCIVYGGRRLGKTALLRHIQAESNDPDAGTAVAYVNILDLGANAGEEQIWEYMSRELKSVFGKPVERDDRFSDEVRRWLDVDSKRRVLVLLDETDRFIQADADKGFAQFVRLQRLMDDTNRRFKFVLAGLHNVTRLVHTENPPLKQIASDPQRVGPLMDAELGDAEALVVRPLAGMGYKFDNREDVWRILSYCNYYPVLVQKFCQQLVQGLGAETLRRRKPVTAITSDHIRHALENEDIAKEIGETFDYTISKIEDRYALIANIVADRATRDAASGRIGEGMSAVEVRDAAALWWPAAFREANRLAVVEDLLDEMEGLGVLRRTPGGRWALRSPTILRLLGDDDKIAAKLGEFMDREAPPVFDPRSMRRVLKGNPRMKVSDGDVCPLTWGQEHDLLHDPTPITIVFGNRLSNVELVSGALDSAGAGSDARREVSVSARAWAGRDAFLKELRSTSGDRTVVHVVDQATDWDADWVAEAGRLKPVREGRARVVFVGEAQHALDWIRDRRTVALGRDVRIVPLQTWSSTLVEHMLQQEHLDPDQCRSVLKASTGGFNRPMREAFEQASSTPKIFASRLTTALSRRLANAALPAELGLVGPMLQVFAGIARYAGDGEITAYEVEEGPIAELGEDLSGLRTVEFGMLMSLLESQVTPIGEGDDARPYRLNPLLLAALAHERT